MSTKRILFCLQAKSEARSYGAILKLIFQDRYALPTGHVSRLRCSLDVNLLTEREFFHKCLCLRVEFLLKTDSGYPKDTGVNKPCQPLRIPFAIKPIGQFHQSPPSPIPGDLGRGPSHHLPYSNIETRMHRLKSVVRVIRGVALTVHVNHLFMGSSSGMYGIRYLRVFDYVSVS